jgi:UDP-N-acetylglucosamine 1-carboxyvinyltransferase
VGATEHALLACVLARGETELVGAAREPEIVDLAACLNAMGAKVQGAGTERIVVTGVTRLSGATYAVAPDRIETGTYALAAAMAGGEVRLTHTRADLVEALLGKMEQAGVEIERRNDGLTVKRNGARLQPVDIETGTFPGFATDLQAQFMALMTLANGESVVRETIFENRFMHVPEMARLGADITVSGGEARVRGVARLEGAQVMATDLRASVGLVIAALAAEGETIVDRVYHLDRGFERLEQKLSACGAQVRRLSSRDGAS